ncbi:hypothetical protein B0J11DRAFT_600526 [Dendryphion nanum]|uniref:RING-type E3 ubiquitin transferase n=1 Tax=Dendryphion nanum TaxID=256645 RepID=A0A9P9E911_9PLEO|nr:hypothetical protein B0J11DRAFT_600526 [Dendryphion nanum]
MSSSDSLNNHNHDHSLHPNPNHHDCIHPDSSTASTASDEPRHHLHPALPHSQPLGRGPGSLLDRILNTPSRTASQRNSPYPSFYFDDAFRLSPSPPPPPPPGTYLDNILNPSETSFLPFGYNSSCFPPLQRGDNLPLLQDSSVWMYPTMPQQPRPPRLPNGYVDLTSESPVVSSAPRRSKPSSPTPGPSAKRTKRADGSSSQKQGSKSPPADIEEIDISDDRVAMRDTLEKQRAEAVKAQQKPEERPTTFNSFTCVICMEIPENITATSCGHLFCHTCLMEALIAGENRAAPGEPKRSQCPVCRKHINRTKQADIIPLSLKKGLLTQPRKNSSISTPKVP